MKKGTKPFPNTIYAWKEDEIYYAATLAKLKEGQQLYGKGWKIESPTAIKDAKDSPKLNETRARRYAITDVNNTLNALMLYGTNTLEKGDVSLEKFKDMEQRGHQFVPDFAEKYELVKFPNRDITLNEARGLGLC